jgi:arylsulfatase A-like enzyme
MHPWQVATAPCDHGDAKLRREILAGYFAAVTAMDAGVGKILDHLEAQGTLEDTLIVFTGDNGMNMGHHGIYGKGNGTMPLNMFDTSVKVPFIVSRPGHVPQNKVCSELLSHYDFMPTLLDYLGLRNPGAGTLPGASFAPLLRGKKLTNAKRKNVVVFDEYGPVRMIRTRTWKYIHRYPYGPHELYDLANDPNEDTNLIDDPAHAAQAQKLKGELDAWFHRYVDPARDAVREPVAGRGQIDLSGPAAKGRKNHANDWSFLTPGKSKADLATFVDRESPPVKKGAEPKI